MTTAREVSVAVLRTLAARFPESTSRSQLISFVDGLERIRLTPTERDAAITDLIERQQIQILGDNIRLSESAIADFPRDAEGRLDWRTTTLESFDSTRDRRLSVIIRAVVGVLGTGSLALAAWLMVRIVQALRGSPTEYLEILTAAAAVAAFVGVALLLTARRGRWHPILAGVVELLSMQP